MLKHRLLFGTLMTALFTALVIFDGWLDGYMPTSVTSDKPVQGTVLGILIVLIIDCRIGIFIELDAVIDIFPSLIGGLNNNNGIFPELISDIESKSTRAIRTTHVYFWIVAFEDHGQVYVFFGIL